MIPIRDAVRSDHIPIVNYLIIGLNVLAFLWQLTQGPQLQQALFLYGVVPSRYSDPSLSVNFTTFQQLIPFLTSMFLHGGVLHILGNMWFLYIFGDNIEDRLGHFRFFLFYMLCGITAGVLHLLTNWHSQLPTIGASGAIAGVMGGYLLLHPRARILTLIPIFFFFQFVEIPAYLFLGFWFVIQLISAGLTRGDVAGVAWWAHIGGFVVGLVLLKLLERVPHIGLSDGLRKHTERQSTPRLQTLSPQNFSEDLNREGIITITPREAHLGTKKLLSIPQGRKKRTVIVTLPPGVQEGTRLRLKGLGQADPEGHRGDLFLEVRVST